jgi:hypothetical protein
MLPKIKIKLHPYGCGIQRLSGEVVFQQVWQKSQMAFDTHHRCKLGLPGHDEALSGSLDDRSVF